MLVLDIEKWLMRYTYKWANRHVGVIVALVFILLGIISTVWGGVKASSIIFDEQQLLGLSIIWGVIAFLVFLAYILGRRFIIILVPILITDKGIEGDFRKNTYEYWPKRNPGFIAWDKIERVERFGFPCMDALKMNRLSGIRIVAGDRKIVIYENIKNYIELRRIIEAKTIKQGSLDEV
ncbi:MAG: hypothetical protein L3J89_14945 [Gammaproteobacteria bacterium]|nr:hypothetical protein [Gammaproteobacteria bacterium]